MGMHGAPWVRMGLHAGCMGAACGRVGVHGGACGPQRGSTGTAWRGDASPAELTRPPNDDVQKEVKGSLKCGRNEYSYVCFANEA